MAKIHEKYVVELAEVIKGYGNPPDVNDPFCLSEFYRFYEIPNVCVSAENFKKMRPLSDFTEEIEPRRGRWIPVTNGRGGYECDQCHEYAPSYQNGDEHLSNFCPNCGADMRGEQDG